MILLSPPEVRRRWGNCSPATFRRVVRFCARRGAAFKPKGYGGRNGLAPLLSARQADTLWKIWNKRKERAFAAMGRKISVKWNTTWTGRRAGAAVKIVSLAELKKGRVAK